MLLLTAVVAAADLDVEGGGAVIHTDGLAAALVPQLDLEPPAVEGVAVGDRRAVGELARRRRPVLAEVVDRPVHAAPGQVPVGRSPAVASQRADRGCQEAEGEEWVGIHLVGLSLLLCLCGNVVVDAIEANELIGW